MELLASSCDPSRFGDVVADEHRLVHVPDDEVLPPIVLERPERRSRATPRGWYFPWISGGEPVLGVALHALPDVQYGAARGVHEDAADLACSRLKSWIVTPKAGRITTSSLRSRREKSKVAPSSVRVDELDPHLRHPLVDVRIVDDLTDEIDPLAIRELVNRLVGVVDRAVDAVAEPELLGETAP